MTETPEIESGIPMPLPRNRKYNWAAMKVGDNMYADGENILNSMRGSATKYKQAHPGWNYTARVNPDGTGRIWRTA